MMQIEMFELPDAELTLKMQCEDCGHIQIVKGRRLSGVNYFGSAYNWCDECEGGLPVAIEEVKVDVKVNWSSSDDDYIYRDADDCAVTIGGKKCGEPLYSADQIAAAGQEVERLKEENAKLRDALDKIATWSTHTSDFSINYGSNGVRDFYRDIARVALEETK